MSVGQDVRGLSEDPVVRRAAHPPAAVRHGPQRPARESALPGESHSGTGSVQPGHPRQRRNVENALPRHTAQILRRLVRCVHRIFSLDVRDPHAVTPNPTHSRIFHPQPRAVRKECTEVLTPMAA